MLAIGPSATLRAGSRMAACGPEADGTGGSYVELRGALIGRGDGDQLEQASSLLVATSKALSVVAGGSVTLCFALHQRRGVAERRNPERGLRATSFVNAACHISPASRFVNSRPEVFRLCAARGCWAGQRRRQIKRTLIRGDGQRPKTPLRLDGRFPRGTGETWRPRGVNPRLLFHSGHFDISAKRGHWSD